MTIDEAIRLSLLNWVKANRDPEARMVTSYQRDNGVGTRTRIWYTHNGPTREIRSVLFPQSMTEMFCRISLDLKDGS